MGGGGSKKGSSTVVQQPAAPQIAPQFEPFASEVGKRALTHLDEFNLSDYSAPLPLQVPGRNQIQLDASQDVANRFYGGIPTPQGEQAAQSVASVLPALAGQQIDVDPIRMDSLNRSIGQSGQTFNPGVQGLTQFSSGDFGNSPAIQAAVQSIANTVTPQIENKMAKAGLGRSGALGQELQSGMIGSLLPLYMQGLQQQQGAASQLANLGYGLEGSIAQQAHSIGQRGEQLGTEALTRGTEAMGKYAIPTFMELGQREGTRDNQRISDAFQTGALERDIQGQQAQADQADLLRRQALAEVFHTAMLGSIPSLTTFPQTQTETYKTPGGK